MTSVGATNPVGYSPSAATGQGQFASAGTSSLDRFRADASATASPTQKLTPVQQGELARAQDAAATKPVAPPASEAGTPLGGIRVASTVQRRADGTQLTTVYVNVKANFVVDGGTLPKGVTAATEAKRIENAIEKDYSKTYKEKNGDTVRYVTTVNMTVATAADPSRTNFVYVASSDARLGGGLGMAPGFEKGNTAYISDAAPARTPPHEFGHLAGLRHVASTYEGCVVPKGTSANNLMSQTGCAPTSQQVERAQLRQIFLTPEFRPKP
jgi:hypothetical protein